MISASTPCDSRALALRQLEFYTVASGHSVLNKLWMLSNIHHSVSALILGKKDNNCDFCNVRIVTLLLPLFTHIKCSPWAQDYSFAMSGMFNVPLFQLDFSGLATLGPRNLSFWAMHHSHGNSDITDFSNTAGKHLCLKTALTRWQLSILPPTPVSFSLQGLSLLLERLIGVNRAHVPGNTRSQNHSSS